MKQPYRTSSPPTETTRKLARRRARLRGLWRRIGGPTTFICVVGGIFSLFNVETCSKANEHYKNGDALNRRHFDDWQAMIDDNQAKMNKRQFELDNHEREFNARLKSFEDIVSMSAVLTKNGSDPSLLKEALRKNNIASK